MVSGRKPQTKEKDVSDNRIDARFAKLIQTKKMMNILLKAFGGGEFTHDQANIALYGTGFSFNSVINQCGAAKTREETSSKTIVNDSCYDFWRYTSAAGWVRDCDSESEAEIFVAQFGGKYEFVHREPTYDIEVKRYYYTLTPANLKVYGCIPFEQEKADVIAGLNEQIEDAKKKIAFLESL